MATTAKAPCEAASRNVVSLERALSKLGLASRSEARALILQGRVSVDGTDAHRSRRPASSPSASTIAIDGAAKKGGAEPLTIILHKPRGYVTTRSDPEGRKTIYDLLADLPERVIPVGRLDLATSGLLILTNDTQFGNWLTDPASEIPRVYLVTVKGDVTDETAARLIKGLTVGGERLDRGGCVSAESDRRARAI